MNRVLAAAAICLVCGALIAGMLIVGGPTQARNEKYDQIRLADLQGIANALSCDKPAKMPTELTKDEIEATCPNPYRLRSLTDPVTQEAYTFQLVNDVKVEVCAAFYDVDQLMKWRPYAIGPVRLEFSGNVGCLTQTFAKLAPT